MIGTTGLFNTFTTALAELEHAPFVTVYVIVVVPAFRPVTIPELETVAMKLFVLVHVPLIVELVKLIVPPSHTLFAPVIAATAGMVLVVITVVAEVVSQPAALVPTTK
jgi:hypothetical protein